MKETNPLSRLKRFFYGEGALEPSENPQDGRSAYRIVKPDPQTQCGHCHATLDPKDRYCRWCGTKRGEGAYAPYREMLCAECIYGPMPIKRRHTCTKCGYAWTTCQMIDDELYCPQCGGVAPFVDSPDSPDSPDFF